MRLVKEEVHPDVTGARGQSAELFNWQSTEYRQFFDVQFEVEVYGANFVQVEIWINNNRVGVYSKCSGDQKYPDRVAISGLRRIEVSRPQEVRVSYYYSNPNGFATKAEASVQLFARTDDAKLSALAELASGTVFDVTTATSSSASGTSNGIGWTYSGSNSMAATRLNRDGAGFMRSTPWELTKSDQIHVWNQGAFTFDTPLKGVFMFMKMNPDMPLDPDLIEFTGIEPEILAGEILRVGDAIGAGTPRGGIVWLPMNGTDKLEFTSPVVEGILDRCIDIAFVAIPVSN